MSKPIPALEERRVVLHNGFQYTHEKLVSYIGNTVPQL